MKKNMGNLDRWLRFIVGSIFGLIWFQNIITGTAAIILLVVGTIFLVTSIVGTCPIYSLFGINSCPRKKVV